MYFELPFEVLALTVRLTCKTGGRCKLAPSCPVGRPLFVIAMAVVRDGRRKGDLELRRVWLGLVTF